MKHLRRLLFGSLPILVLAVLAPAASSQQPAASSQQPAASDCSLALGDEEPSPLDLHWQGLAGAVELIDAGSAPVIAATNQGEEALTFDLQVDVEGTVMKSWPKITLKAGHTISLAVPVVPPAQVPGVLSRQMIARARLYAGGQPTVWVNAPQIFFHEDEEVEGKSFILYSEAVMREEFAGGTLKNPTLQEEAATLEWDEGKPVKFGGSLLGQLTTDQDPASKDLGPGNQEQGEK